MKHILQFHLYESLSSSGLTPEQESFLNTYTSGTWSVNPTTGLVDIQGNFELIRQEAKSFLGIEFGNVTGNFYCSINKLQSLVGAPRKVGGKFNCYMNELQSLKGAPQEVGKNFICNSNKFQSLEGGPQKVDGSFYCLGGKLTSLEGAPQKVGGDFWCSKNQLTSLEGAPQEIVGCFDCSNNELQSLVGAPQKVNGNFFCNHNELQSLVGAPQKVNGGFNCSNNELQSLVGAPQEVGSDFYCMENELQSLEGAPKKIIGVFKCDEFHLGFSDEEPGWRGSFNNGWNMEGWLEVLENGSEEAKKLILTLPLFNSEYWNSRISENPNITIIQLSEVWADLPDEVRNSIRIPPNLEDVFDNLVDLTRKGIM